MCIACLCIYEFILAVTIYPHDEIVVDLLLTEPSTFMNMKNITSSYKMDFNIFNIRIDTTRNVTKWSKMKWNEKRKKSSKQETRSHFALILSFGSWQQAELRQSRMNLYIFRHSVFFFLAPLSAY